MRKGWRLDERLEIVASMIESECHCDVGTDHAYLLAALLDRGRIKQAIAVEKTPGPLRNAQRTLAGFDASVRQGDGLEVVDEGEADSLSICGMGGELITRILGRYPARVSQTLIVQPNTKAECVRQWAWEAGFWVEEEQLAPGVLLYPIIKYRRAEDESCQDPAYAGILPSVGFQFGPLNLSSRNPLLIEELRIQQRRLAALPKLNEQSRELRLLVDAALTHIDGPRAKNGDPRIFE